MLWSTAFWKEDRSRVRHFKEEYPDRALEVEQTLEEVEAWKETSIQSDLPRGEQAQCGK